jgi:hypothetical protein
MAPLARSFCWLVVYGLGLTLAASTSAQDNAAANRIAPAVAAAQPIATPMIPADAVGAFFFFPQEVLKTPELKLMPIEIADAWLTENVGIKLADIESVRGYTGIPGPLGPNFGMLIKLNADLDATRINRDRFAGPAEKVGELTAIPLRDMPGSYLHRVDPKTYVIATIDMLSPMVTSNGKTGPMAEMLAGRSRTSPLVLAAAMEPIRPMVEQAVAAGAIPASVPPPLNNLRKFPSLAKGVVTEMSPMGNRSEIVVVANNDVDAKELQLILQDGMSFGRDMAILQAMQQVQGEDAVSQATRSYFQRLANEIVTMLQPQLDGDELTIRLEGIQTGYASSGVMVGLLLPAVQAAREAARRTSSMNNMKQILLAMHNYHDAMQKFPDARARNADGKLMLSWRVALLPYLEEGDLYNQFHLDEPWDSEHNLKLVAKMPKVYADPSAPALPGTEGLTNYHVPFNDGLLFDAKGPTHFRDVTDGTSNTIALFEAARPVPWTMPEDAEINQADPAANLSRLRAGIFQVGFADGSVQALPQGIDAMTLWSLFTRAGGEVVNRP